MKSVVSAKGQVTIPKKVRDSLGIQAGTVLDFRDEGGRLVAEKRLGEDPIAKWIGSGKVPGGGTVTAYLKSVRGR